MRRYTQADGCRYRVMKTIHLGASSLPCGSVGSVIVCGATLLIWSPKTKLLACCCPCCENTANDRLLGVGGACCWRDVQT